MAPTPFQWKKRMTAERKELWAHILWTLKLDGDIVGASNANKELRSRLEARGVVVAKDLGLQLAEMAQRAQGSLITREINGRIPVSIRLNARKLPENPFPPEEPEVVEVAETVAPTQPQHERPAMEAPAIPIRDGASVGDLAAELVDVALRLALLATDTPAPDQTIALRLSTALEEAQRARSKAELAETTTAAVQARNRELERQLAVVQGNLTAALKNRSIDDRPFKDADRLVRSAPTRR